MRQALRSAVRSAVRAAVRGRRSKIADASAAAPPTRVFSTCAYLCMEHEPDMKMFAPAFLLSLGALSIAAADEPVSDATAGNLLSKYGCQACHTVYKKGIGPSYAAIAQRYASDPNADDEVAQNILNGSSGAWGSNEMPSNDIPDSDLTPMVEWILALR